MRRSGQLGFFLAALELCVPLYAAVGTPESQAVLTAFRAHCDKVRSVEFKASTQWLESGRTVGTQEFVGKYEPSGNGMSMLGRFYGDSVSGPTGTALSKTRTVVAHDGAAFWGFSANVLQKGETDHLSGTISTRSAPHLQDPWRKTFYALESWSLDHLFDGAEVSGPIDWNGRQVYAISAFYGRPDEKDKKHNFRMYLDPAHDYAKVYSEWFMNNGAKVESVEVKEFMLVGDIWLPSVAESWHISDSQFTAICRIEYVAVNTAFADDDFHIKFPPGTAVNDKVRGIEYEIPSVQNEGAGALQESINDLRGKEQALESSAGALKIESPVPVTTVSGGTPHKEETRRWSGIFLAATGFVLGVCIVLLIRRFGGRAQRRGS